MTIKRKKNHAQSNQGMAIDATGSPAFDPSRNVLDLVEAAIARQDDLREADQRFLVSQVQHVAELSALRASHVHEVGKAETSRIDTLRNVQLQHVEQMAVLRADHTRELLVAEAGRINAIREVDVSGVATAASRQDQQAVVLANQVATSAETLRALVASTNAAVASNMSQIASQLSERMAQLDKISSDRITQLEKTSYEGKGKEAVSDPMLTKMVDELRNLRLDVTTSAGKGQGMDQLWKYIVAAAGSGGVVALLSHLIK